MTVTPSESVPVVRPSRPLSTRLLIALLVTLIVTGWVFWSGYFILRSPSGWVGDRRFVPVHLSSIQEDLAKYHKEHGVYPETLRDVYDELYTKPGEKQTDEDYNRLITVYRHPVEYERTGTGWQITDYGADGKPGGIGLDADLVVTDKMNDDQVFRELYSGKYNATFEQVRTDDSNHFRTLFVTSLVFGGLVFAVTFTVVGSVKKEHIAATIVSVVLITIAAIIAGGAIMMAHTVASGH